MERGVLRQRETGLRIGEMLVAMGAVTEEDVGWALSRQLALTFVDIDPESLDAALVRSLDESLLRRSDAVPLLRDEAGLSIAVADPTDALALDRLEAASGVPLQLVIGTPSAIRRALDHVLGPRRGDAALAPPSVPPDPAEGARLYDVVWERSGDTFLAFHVASALRQGAREIHFLPGDGQLHVHYREGDRLVPIATEPERIVESLLARIEALGGPVLGEALHARGRLRCPVPQADVLLDASLLRAAEGVCVTLVPCDEAAPPSLEDLGVEPGDAAELREALSGDAGVVLVCGPRGAGGSALLAALAAAAGTEPARVLVIEAARGRALPWATRLALPPAAARVEWPAIAVAQRADVVVLDDLPLADAIAAAHDGAASQRLLLVRTEACDTGALLDRLLAAPGARGIVGPRLLAVLQTRRLAGAVPPQLVETLVVGDALRDGIEEGADGAHLVALATASGFRTLAQLGAARVAAGQWTEAAVRRART